MPKSLIIVIISVIVWSCAEQDIHSLRTDRMLIEYNSEFQSRISPLWNGAEAFNTQFRTAEYLILADSILSRFRLQSAVKKQFEDNLGSGEMLVLQGKSGGSSTVFEKILRIKLYRDFPDLAVFRVVYINEGEKPVNVTGWVNNAYQITSPLKTDTVFWSFQGATYESRPDWVLPLKPGFKRENYMGMNASDYGGGIPVCDIWRRDAGLAVGHVETVPKLISLPVQMDSLTDRASLEVKYLKDVTLHPGDTLKTFDTFVSLHQGDYFNALRTFARFMDKKGIHPPQFPETSYEPVWCAWGYERNFKVNDVLATLPKVKALGYKWAVLDDGWQTAEGDWYLNPEKFPRGDADMKAFVDKIHKQGLKAKLWWAPLAVDPGTDLHKNHPDLLLINKEGKTQDISWWDSYYLCPANEGAIEYTRKLVQKFIGEWGFDGLKIDGQHLNAVPPCYNPAHHHAYPEESIEKLPQFFKMIYKTATSVKSDAVVEICPCGTAASFYNMAWMNQPVSSDPTSSWQIRLKGKTYKALMGPNVPYYGDHVELSDDMDDFASTIGIGGVPGTKFVWPPGIYYNEETGDVSLTAQKEREWKKWVYIYNRYELPKGIYHGELYDIGFDKPETHVIEKNGNVYFAFYAPQWKGEVELRGLQNRRYTITDFEHDMDMQKVKGPTASIKVNFKNHLLLKAVPVQ